MSDVFTREQRRTLAGQAQTIVERLANSPSADPVPETDETFREWVETFPNEESFRDRLAMDGWTETDARQAVAAEMWPNEYPLPEWVVRLEELLDDLRTPQEWIKDEIGSDTPFVRVFGAIVDHAWRQLQTTDVSTTAARSTVSWLANRLQMIAVRSLYVEFKSYVEHFDPELVGADPSEFNHPPTEHHEQFVATLLEDGLASIFLEYPVMGRLTVETVDNWISWLCELWTRLQSDRACLERSFEVEGEIEAFEPLSVDTHARGRVPVRVVFETGNVVYKPRSVEAQRTLCNTVSALSRRLPTQSLPTPTVLDRGDYGWMEWVSPDIFESESTVQDYYRRAGILLCLAYVLNMTDLQFENVVATRDGPVFVDAETVCHTDCGLNGFPDAAIARTTVQQSVLRTGLLPVSVTKTATPDTPSSVSLAGLGDTIKPVDATGHERPEFRAPNTDVVKVTQTTPTIDKSDASPSDDDTVYPPSSYRSVLTTAFERCYEHLQKLHDRGELFGEVLDLSSFEGIETRHLFRPSPAYQSVLKSAYSARALQDGIRFSIEVESLAASLYTDGIDRDRYWALYTAEREALRQADIPRIVTTPDDPQPVYDGRQLETTLPATGLDRVQERIDDLSTADKRRQVEFIKKCLGGERDDEGNETETISPLKQSRPEYIETAKRSFDRVLDASMEKASADRWVEMVPGPETLHVRQTGVSLYHGRAGIGLTAAALWATTGCERYRERAETIMSTALVDTRERLSSLPLGAAHGVGSVVYAGTVVADLLGSSSLENDVSELVVQIAQRQFTDADTLGVVSGIAGALLAFLVHYDRTGDTEALIAARQCGRQLLTASDHNSDTGSVTGEGIGFAHGDSGVAYALARLTSQTNDQEFETAARETFEAIATVSQNEFRSDRRNWWCRGWPGITVAVAGGAEILDGFSAPEWVAGSVSPQQSLVSLDHVCCGNAGRVAAALTVARRLSIEEQGAHDLMAAILRRRQERGVLSLPGHSQKLPNPTFFNGITGVAYTLARLDSPDVLPSIVSFR